MDNSILASYARLRLLVGYLGEKAQANWWSTSFFEKVSRTFLEPVFPHTYQLSQYNGVRQAASLLHDEFIGVGSAFHLFRLPEENEQDLQKIILAAPEIWFQVLSSRETAMNALIEIAGEPIEVTEGPKLFGMLNDLYQHDSIQGLAQHYLGAFKQEVRCLPYFTKLS
jgi:hypothetical protein